jgi:Leucine-rich repeat (LRR) protein
VLKQKITIEGFTRLCRELDIGGQYRTYLNENLGFTNALVGTVLKRKVIDAHSSALKSALHLAQLRREIESDACDAILALLEGRPDRKLDGQALHCHDLTMMSSTLTGIVIFAPDLERPRNVRRIVVYIPDDPEHPVKQYPDSQAFIIELTRQLRSPDYQQFFSRFVDHQERGHFFADLGRRLSHVTWHPHDRGDPLPSWRETPIDKPHLQYSVSTIKTNLWTHLYQRQLNKILNDARVLAVSTADADRNARWARWDILSKIASTLLEVAAFVALPFVPFLGELMLAYAAYQMLDETFEAIVDWAENLQVEAFEHLMGVVEAAVQLGTFAIGGAIAIAELKPLLHPRVLAFFDTLTPVKASDGKTRYWKPELTTYEQKIRLPQDSKPDDLGLHQHQGKNILQIEDKHYAVEKSTDTDAWNIQHPDRPDAYQSPLRHNGEGAWTTELDRPLHWEKTRLVRRMGPHADAFGDAEIDQILGISNSDEGILRKSHVLNDSAPPVLTDTLNRFRIDKDIQRFIEQLNSDDPRQYCAADAQTQLQLLTSNDLWPKTKALRLLDTQANPVWEFSSGEDLPVVQIDQAHLNNGDLLMSVLQALDQHEIHAMLGENFGDGMIRLDARARTLRKKLAQLAENNRATIFDSRYQELEATRSTDTQTLTEAVPDLPGSVARELLRQANGNELEEIGAGRIPKRLEDLAHQAREEVRITRAYEGLHLDSTDSIDTGRLALRSLERLPGWSSDVRIDIHDHTFGGPQIDSLGDADAPIHKVLVLPRDARYQAFDDEGQQLSGATDLYSALLQALPDNERNRLNIHIGQQEKLKQAIRHNTVGRSDLRTAFGLEPVTEPVVETLRLLGSDSYRRINDEPPLSLEDRAREVYPGLAPEEIQALLQRLQEHPSGPRAELSRLRNEYQQLVNDLQPWANDPPAVHPHTNLVLSESQRAAERQNRRLLREEILRCWRRESDHFDDDLGSVSGYTFRLSQPIIGDLPALTADFSHVSSLSLNNSAFASAVDPFLGRFPALRRLEMRDFTLETLPQTLSALPNLEELVLSDCNLVLNAESQATLGSLNKLQALDLYNNPLGLVPDLRTLPKLTYIDLSGTHISRIPAGLENHPAIRTAVLHDNLITELPASLLEMPGNIGEGFDLGNNPLSPAARERVKAYFNKTEQDLGVYAEQADLDRAQALYPDLDNEEASEFIYRLPGTLSDGRIELTRREAELARLRDELDTWATDGVPAIHPVTGNPLSANEMFVEHGKREEFKQRLEQCWRKIPTEGPTVSDQGFTSPLSIMGDLPVLTAEFDHVPELYLTSDANTGSTASRFLEYFPNLDSLTVRGFQLHNIPEAVFRMGRLTVLNLPECGITLTPETVNALAGMDNLDYLNLRNNPLGLTPDLSQMSDISSLNLSRTGITEIPRGVLSIQTWTDVDLSNNAITEMPAELLQVNPDVAESFNFNHNPFTNESLQRIAAYYRATEVDLGVDAVANMPVPPDEAPDTDIED